MQAWLETKTSREAGLTLVELILAAAILGVIMLLMGQVFSTTTSTWSRGEGDAERRRGTRALTDFIARELQEAMLPVEIVKSNSSGNLRFLVNPPSSMVPDEYRHADAIFWQAPLATESSYGEIAELGYFVKWIDGIPMLCRMFVNPSIKVGGQRARNPHFLIYDSNPNAWLSGAKLSEVVQPENASLGYPGLFAEYVLGIWVELYDENGEPIAKQFDSQMGYPFKKIGSSITQRKYLPERISVSIVQTESKNEDLMRSLEPILKRVAKDNTVLSASQYIEQLKLEADGDPSLQRFIPLLRVYSTSVKLRNAR